MLTKKDISNTMKSFFCTVGEELACKIDATPNPLLSGDYGDTNKNVGFRFRTIEVQVIRGSLAVWLKLQRALAMISPAIFFQLALPFIVNSLACLFNTPLVTSQFPDSWKLARVTPTFKEGDKTEKSNYRPISVLPVISRLF